MLCTAAGLTCGLLEGFVLLLCYELTDLNMYNNGVSPPILWIAPLVNAGIFIAAGLIVLAMATRRGRKKLSFAPAAAILAGIAAFGVSMSPRSLNVWACALLALGVGVQTFRVARAGGFSMPAIRRSLPALIAVLVALGFGGTAWTWWQERAFLSSLPHATVGRPNVLLIVLDTVRADHLSSYGYARRTTPHLDRIAAEGMLFENAYAAYTWTQPSHLAMLSGAAAPDRLRGGHDPVPMPQRLLPETLAANGYVTAACAANNMWCTPKAGMGRGFARFDVYFHSAWDSIGRSYYGKGVYLVFKFFNYDNPGRKLAGDVNAELLDFLDDTDDHRRPFFAMLNYFDTHAPYAPQPPFDAAFSRQVTRSNLRGLLNSDAEFHNQLSPADRQLIVDAYDSSLAYLDNAVGELRAQLERRGLFDNTLVIITADHGEALGEEGRYLHGGSARQETTRVPLILRYPRGVPQGARVSTPVSLQRIPGTVEDVLDLNAPYREDSLLDRSVDDARPVLISGGEECALILDRWHLIFDEQRMTDAYDLRRDPRQRSNLLKNTAMTPLLNAVWIRAEGAMRNADAASPCTVPRFQKVAHAAR